MRKFGLIGRNISYSFSRTYFSEKFTRTGLDASYENFDIDSISEFPAVLEKNPELQGLNVTIPYKEAIIPFLDEMDPVASEIGAVNTIKIDRFGKMKGFNTDYYGFLTSIEPGLTAQHKKALILGTGGASKAVVYALQSLDISCSFVSRSPLKGDVSYADLDKNVMREHLVIVNCTPLGTFPGTDAYPNVPVEFLTPDHLVFDLIYNPPVTRLMALAKQKGAAVLNGQEMLELQANKAWDIWNTD